MLFIMSDFLPKRVRTSYNSPQAYTIHSYGTQYTHTHTHTIRLMGTYCIHEFNRLLPVARDTPVSQHSERLVENGRARARASPNSRVSHKINESLGVRAPFERDLFTLCVAFGQLRAIDVTMLYATTACVCVCVCHRVVTQLHTTQNTYQLKVIDTKRMSVDLMSLPHTHTTHSKQQTGRQTHCNYQQTRIMSLLMYYYILLSFQKFRVFRRVQMKQ